MIRKIAIALVVLFVIAWIVLAHFAKSKLISLIDNSQTDNIKLSYTDTSIGGFPFSWKIRFTSPKITIINHVISREISSDYLNCTFDYKLGNARLDFGKVLYYSSASDEAPVDYKLYSQENITASVDLIDIIYKIDLPNSLRKIVRNVEFDNPSLVALNNNGEELFNLSGLGLKFTNNLVETTENFSLKLLGHYKSSSNNLNVGSVNLALDANYVINNSNITAVDSFDRKIELTNAKIDLDNASCDLKGSVILARNDLPKGKISVELVNYETLADILVPDDFIFSKPYVKRFIAKAAAIEFSNEVTNKVKFDIEFSDKGIALGHVNLVEQKDN